LFFEKSAGILVLNFTNDVRKPETEEQKEEKKEKKEEALVHKPFLHVLNLVRTKHIPGVKRGARTKAMAICTQNQHVHIFKPLLLLALDAFFEKGEERLVFFNENGLFKKLS